MTQITSQTARGIGNDDDPRLAGRPVLVEGTEGHGYRIVGENISPGDERWAFETGEVVHSEEHRFSDGRIGLVAVRRAS